MRRAAGVLIPLDLFRGKKFTKKPGTSQLAVFQNDAPPIKSGRAASGGRDFGRPNLSARQWLLQIREAESRDRRNRGVFRQLVAQGLVSVDHEAHGALKLAEPSRTVLRGEATVAMRRTVARAAKAPRVRGEAAALDAASRGLFDALRGWRLEQARTQGVPAYVVLHDRTLAAIAQTRPGTIDALARIDGIGAAKLDRYGGAIVALVTGASATTP